jgi:hypothetical protein
MSDSSWSRRGVDGRVKPGHDDEGLRRSRKKARPTGIAIRARLSPEPSPSGFRPVTVYLTPKSRLIGAAALSNRKVGNTRWGGTADTGIE